MGEQNADLLTHYATMCYMRMPYPLYMDWVDDFGWMRGTRLTTPSPSICAWARQSINKHGQMRMINTVRARMCTHFYAWNFKFKTLPQILRGHWYLLAHNTNSNGYRPWIGLPQHRHCWHTWHWRYCWFGTKGGCQGIGYWLLVTGIGDWDSW